jgi:putative sigma-54 modulation protein
MQIKISARHGHLHKDQHDFILEKAEKLVHIFGRIMSVEVTVDLKDPAAVEVEFNVKAEHKSDLVARERSADVRAACDLVLHKLEGQLRRYKEKIQDHRRDRPTRELVNEEEEGVEEAAS